MSPAKRRFEPGVIRRLLDEPQRFGFFQAVRIIELWLKKNGVPGDHAVTRHVRFRNTTSLCFPASELESIATESTGAQDSKDSDVAGHHVAQRIALTTSFMGFLGASGTLPSHYSERIAAHRANRSDDGARAFLDIFSSRAVTLFYEAWRKYRLEFKYELGNADRFLPLLLALAGFDCSGEARQRAGKTQGDDGIGDEPIGYFAGILRQRPVSATSLAQVLQEYFDVPIAVGQFAGHWYQIPCDQQCALGGANAILGKLAMMGERVWQRDLRVQLRIGPLSRASYDAFLPGGRFASALEKLLGMLCGTTFEYEIELALRAEDAQCVRLGVPGCGGMLGWNAFVIEGEGKQVRRDVRYLLHAIE